MQPRRINPRAQYRLEQSQRITNSASIAQKFPKLKSLSVHLKYFGPDGITPSGGMKYKPNLEHAKSIFCFPCPDHECIAGDFDLSEDLAKAVARSRKSVVGELRCAGWHYNAIKERVPCLNLLRYELSLAYGAAA